VGVGASLQSGGGTGAGGSLELQVEGEQWLAGVTFLAGSPHSALWARAGWVHGGLYLAGGFGPAHVGGYGLGDATDGRDGYAIIPEAGILLLRENRFGRVNPYLAAIVPLNTAHWTRGTPLRDVPAEAMVGIRLLL